MIGLRTKACAATLGIGVLIVLGAQPVCAQEKPIALQDAIELGLVSAEFSGNGHTSGDVITMVVARTAKSPAGMVLYLAPGSILKKDNPFYQDMVIDQIHGPGDGDAKMAPSTKLSFGAPYSSRFLLRAYCIQYHKAAPALETRFHLRDADPVLGCLVREGREFNVLQTQLAVWIYTDLLTPEHYGSAFGSGVRFLRDDWGVAWEIDRRCNALPERR